MSADVSYRRYRRRILGWGAAALLVVFAVGATVTLTRVEDDLEGRVVAELDSAGVAGVRVSFSGQEGTLTCTQPLETAEHLASLREVASEAEVMHGVRAVQITAGCRVADDAEEGAVAAGTPPQVGDQDAAMDAATTTSAESEADHTVLELVAADERLSALHQALEATGVGLPVAEAHVTFFAPSNEAFETLTDEEAETLLGSPELLAAILEQHVVVGEVPLQDLEAGDLEAGNLEMVSGATVGVSGATAATAGSSDGVILRVAGSTAVVIDGDLLATDGVVHVVDGLLIPARVRLAQVDPDVEAATRAAALQIDLDALTDSTQLGFAAGGVEVSFLSGPTLDRVADAIIGRPGTRIVVRGHTDSGGDDLDNLFVSTARANAVLEQLVVRGVPRSRMRHEGVGASAPVLVDGVEDRVASRRVDFVVETE